MAVITVAGLGRLGSPFAALLAAAGHRVHGVDPDPMKVDAINDGFPPVDEPGLGALIAHLPDGQLTAGTLYDGAVRASEATFVVVPTPSLPDGRFDASMVDAAAAEVRRVAAPGHLLAVCSTVSPGTMDALPAPEGGRVAYCPFLVALGDVLFGMVHPDLMIVGGSESARRRAVQVLETVVPDDVPAPPLTLLEAEVTKLTINTLLTAKAAWANTVGSATAAAGGDPSRVLAAVGRDHRIGGAFLRPGAPPGGPCLPRDGRAMGAFLRDHGQVTDVRLACATVEANEGHLERILSRLVRYRRVAVLGLAYKPGTAVTDESLGVAAARRLAATGVDVTAHDPHARPHGIRLALSARDALSGADAVLIACPHPEYQGLDFEGRVVVDPWQLLG